jgi:hypothetical protein
MASKRRKSRTSKNTSSLSGWRKVSRLQHIQSKWVVSRKRFHFERRATVHHTLMSARAW